MLSKFKQLFNIDDGSNSAFLNWFLFPPRRIFNKIFCTLLLSVVICLVVVPCSVKLIFVTTFQESSKSINSVSVSAERSRKQIVGVNRISEIGVFEHGQFRIKSSQKSVGGVIESLDFLGVGVSTCGKSVADPENQASSQNCRELATKDYG